MNKEFINAALDEGIKGYLKNKNRLESVEFNSFLVVVVRVLTKIYGELDIINPYYVDSGVVFIKNLCKYGMSENDIMTFLNDLLSFYHIDLDNKESKIKQKNGYFTKVLTHLVDMFIAKKKSMQVSDKEEEEFLELIYTSKTKNPLQISYNYLTSNDPTFIEKYYYLRINNKDINSTSKFDLNKTLINALEPLNSLNDLSKTQIRKLSPASYKYFLDDASNTKNKGIKIAVESFRKNNLSLSTGNGYVDILLLMSVIVTSFSTIAIILFYFM